MSPTNIAALDCGFWCLESETDILVPPPATLSDSLGLSCLALGIEEDVRLFLEGTLALDCQFGRHVCGIGEVGGGRLTVYEFDV